MKVFIAQFAKKGDFSEIKALKRFSDLVTVEQFGLGRFIDLKPTDEDIAAAQQGLDRVKEILASGDFQVVILDEANVAVLLKLISAEDLAEVIRVKPPAVELVITGRGAVPQILELADLVSDIKAVKHYFQNGIRARVGIEK